jgi:tetratricopeptide (TPR) repeat protein
LIEIADMKSKNIKIKVILQIVFVTFLSFNSPILRADVSSIQRLTAEGNFLDALKLTNEELQKNGNNVTYRFLKGLILTRMDKLEQARDVFIEITESNPDLPEPYNNLAVIYASMGDFDKARNLLEQAINTHPTYATAHENIGDIYAKLASQAYNQALELDKENNAARAKLSLVNDLFSHPETVEPVVLANNNVKSDSDNTQARPVPVVEPVPNPTNDIAPPAATKLTSIDDITDEIRQREEELKRQNELLESQLGVSLVKQTVLDWSVSWSKQEIEKYLSFYAEDFTPEDNRSLEEWRQYRRQRLTVPGGIQIVISDLVVELLGSDHAQATFTQVYQSNTYRDRVKKTMLLKLENNNWRITQEKTK